MIYLRYFREFSRKRSEVFSDIRNHRTVLVEHILKLYYYRDFVECLDGWIEEVQAFLGEVSKIKTVHGKDRFPTPEEIYKEAWANDLDNIDNRHNRYISDFSKYGMNDFVRFETVWLCYYEQNAEQQPQRNGNDRREKYYFQRHPNRRQYHSRQIAYESGIRKHHATSFSKRQRNPFLLM